MGSRIHALSPTLIPQPIIFGARPFSSIFNPIRGNLKAPRTLRIACSKDKESFTDEILALELGVEIKKLNTRIIQSEEALKKSRELLFTEVCDFVGLESEEDLEKKWKRMNEEDKWVLVKGFVAEWSAHFHPLSARSVKEMVEEHIVQRDESSNSGSSNLFLEFGKLLGFQSSNE